MIRRRNEKAIMFRASVLDIKTTRIVYQELVESVILPGEEGELSVLDFHQPIICCLKKGVIRINKNIPIEIKRGIAKVKRNELVALVEK